MTFSARVFSKVKRVANEHLGNSFAGGIIAKQVKGNYMLMYHGVTADGNVQFNRRHASVACFKKQLVFLKKYCAVISVDDFFNEKFVIGKPNFALTFDDGYLNNFVHARPLLEEYKCPATFFITGLNEVNDSILWADYVNIASALTSDDIEVDGEFFKKMGATYVSQTSGKSVYEVVKHQKAGYDYKLKVKAALGKHVSFENVPAIKEYWQLMTDEQIKQSSRSKYIQIGSHGYYHNNLGNISPPEAESELHASKKYLENLVQYDIKQLAYPDGSYTTSLVSAAGKMGFDVQLAADHYLFNEKHANRLIKKRYGIYTVDSCLNQLLTAVKTP